MNEIAGVQTHGGEIWTPDGEPADATQVVMRAEAKMATGLDQSFEVRLVTQVEGNLWQGGVINGVRLPAVFEHVVSLYSQENYVAAGPVKSHLRTELHDSAEAPPKETILALAKWVNHCRAEGKTLVHCQAGLNRSALVCAVALWLEGTLIAKAIARLREARSPMVLCNAHFERWLLEEFSP